MGKTTLAVEARLKDMVLRLEAELQLSFGQQDTLEKAGDSLASCRKKIAKIIDKEIMNFRYKLNYHCCILLEMRSFFRFRRTIIALSEK